MSLREKQLIDEFDVRSDDGYETTILVYQDILDAGHMGDPHATIAGMKEAWTADGHRCNRMDDDTFQVVSSGLVVRRV